MNKKKYLYWIGTTNEEKETVWREMYSRIGVIVHLSQMIEYNLANIIAIAKMKKEVIEKEPISVDEFKELRKKCDKEYERINGLSLGKIKKEMENTKLFPVDMVERTAEVLSIRNHVIHHIFKDDLFTKEFAELENVDQYIDKLNETESKMVLLNEEILEVFRKNKIQTVLFRLDN